MQIDYALPVSGVLFEIQVPFLQGARAVRITNRSGDNMAFDNGTDPAYLIPPGQVAVLNLNHFVYTLQFKSAIPTTGGCMVTISDTPMDDSGTAPLQQLPAGQSITGNTPIPTAATSPPTAGTQTPVTGSVSISGNVTVGTIVNTVTVTGSVTVANTVAISGTVTVQSITNAVTVNGTVTVGSITNPVTVTGTITVTGTVNIGNTVVISGTVTVGSITNTVTITNSTIESNTTFLKGLLPQNSTTFTVSNNQTVNTTISSAVASIALIFNFADFGFINVWHTTGGNDMWIIKDCPVAGSVLNNLLVSHTYEEPIPSGSVLHVQWDMSSTTLGVVLAW